MLNLAKIKDFWKKYETKIILVIGFLLVATISFEGGYLQGKNQSKSFVSLEKASPCVQNCPENSNNSSVPETSVSESKTVPKENESSQKECAFVASKNSKKYHLPTCRFAKNIKPENKICFESEEEAKQKGFEPCGTCLK